ncbi:PASTA domain-containing protein [Bifidobacterium miconisargentati]|uniref:PASTA domain-containing protein n=1 Tax=Bifidobacterium miconisargentati TaxID=2834437 RepID=UPI001BDD07B0|nr:PASTA domain-containing protein [Bifidobacterium miconisargentati]
MMICPNCHSRMPEGCRFCTNCGTPLMAAPAPRPVPLPDNTATVVPVKHGPDKLVVALSALLVVLIVAAISLFATYRLEMWGGKTLPSAETIAKQVAAKTGVSNGKVQAKDVTEALKNKGLNVRTVPVFSGEDRGAFLGYDGMEQGQRVEAGTTVKVRESAGPGVPKDTIGKQAADVVDTFAGMNVPVHYKKVPVKDPSKTPEGSVAVTYPAAGQGLPDENKDDGIYIGVASKGDGIPVDIMGMDRNEAVDLLESQGYTVDLEPHYSSKQYVGRISGSYPGPGSTPDKSDTVTLYYGVDQSSNTSLLTKTGGGTRYASMDSVPMIGMYCKSTVTDTSKDCITLEQTSGPWDTGSDNTSLHIKGHDLSTPMDALGLTNFSQDVSGAMVEPSDNVPENEMPMRNHLLLKDWGMFELYSGMGLPNCGDEVFGAGSVGEYCIDGKYYNAFENGDGSLDPPGGSDNYKGPTGSVYRMKDFLVYFPVGSDLAALEDSGYFDADSLAKAKKQKAVDTSRPFILLRDTSQYDKTEVPADDYTTPNPFVPTNTRWNGYKSDLVKMKPAPSDATVYYLVEQDGDLDWSSLPDADVK